MHIEHKLTDLRCMCPCHSLKHPLHVSASHNCCCPHRHVVPEDCPKCMMLDK